LIFVNAFVYGTCPYIMSVLDLTITERKLRSLQLRALRLDVFLLHVDEVCPTGVDGTRMMLVCAAPALICGGSKICGHSNSQSKVDTAYREGN
jgi:hypothetical protein